MASRPTSQRLLPIRAAARRPLGLALALMLAAGALAACGGSDDDPTPDKAGGAGDLSEALDERTWVLDGAGSTPPIPGGSSVTLAVESGRMSGRAPCNTYNAEFTIDGDRVALGPIATTRMACDPATNEAETAFLTALEQVDSVAVDGDRLTLTNGDDVDLVFDTQDLATALVGTWEIVNLATDDALATPLEGTTPTIEFADDGTLSADAGCNKIGSTWELDGSTLSIGDGQRTLMACEDPQGLMEQEDALGAALNAAARVEISEQLTIFNDKGEILIVADRAAEG